MTEFKHTPAEAVAAWVAALRSGEFKQARGHLRIGDGFCCLGVACELFRRMEGRGEWEGGGFLAEHDWGNGALPPAVLNWLGLATPLGDFTEESGTDKCLADENDDGASFPEIADLIEGRPHDLFVKQEG